MRQRHSAKGPFWGCPTYPACTGTRSVEYSAPAERPVARPAEVPGPTGALITDLREAAGHLGRAIDLLRRRQPEIDQLLDERDGITF